MQMASIMRGAGLDPLADPFGGSSPIAPGNPNTTPTSAATSTNTPPVGGAAPSGTQPMPNLFGGDPGALLQLLGGVPPSAVPPSADARPPEERFQVQLQVRHFVKRHPLGLTCISLSKQLQDMGFTNASQNVRALLATGGNVHSAIEYILGGGGL